MLKILTLAVCLLAVAQEAQAADLAASRPAPVQASGHVKVFDGRTDATAPRADMIRPPTADKLAAPVRPRALPAIQKVRDAGR